jgi:hypothetical protein
MMNQHRDRIGILRAAIDIVGINGFDNLIAGDAVRPIGNEIDNALPHRPMHDKRRRKWPSTSRTKVRSPAHALTGGGTKLLQGAVVWLKCTKSSLSLVRSLGRGWARNAEQRRGQLRRCLLYLITLAAMPRFRFPNLTPKLVRPI